MTERPRQRRDTSGRVRLTGPMPAPIEYAVSQRALTEGNRVELLVGGEQAFPAMLAAIAGARREVLLESYIIVADGTGNTFQGALMDAARRGCDVRLICDGVGSFGLPDSFFTALSQAGVKTAVYRPVAPWRQRWGLWRRDHRKLLAVDGQVGFVGGINIADEYDARTEKGHGWRDLHVRLAGPSVAKLGALFARTWNRAVSRRERMTWQAPSLEAAQDGIPVAVIGNREQKHRSLIRGSFLHAVRMARRSVILANPYFLPDAVVLRALRDAARREVDVRVIVPRRSDIWIIDLAARAAFPRLLRAGVRIAEWPGMIHAKAAAIDGAFATVGSYNFDRRSLHFNLEVTANLFDAHVASSVEAQLRADFGAAQEIHIDDLARRPLSERILSAIFYSLRAIL